MNRLPADYVKTSHKLTFLAMIAIITLMGPVCPLSAQNDRPVHISVRNEPLSKVLKNIEKQSGYLFFYNTKEVDPRRRLSLELSGSDIRETAEHIAKILGLTYSIKGRHIVFTPTVTATADQAGKVGITSLYGMVTDSKGRPLPGVTAISTGKTRGTTTEDGGKYNMEVRQGGSDVVSGIGRSLMHT